MNALMAHGFADLVQEIGALRRDRDIWNPPGELSLAALIRAAEPNPTMAAHEYRLEALRASTAAQAANVFAERGLRARAHRFARAADHVERLCGPGLADDMAFASIAVLGFPERRVALEPRRVGWRGGGRRADDSLAGREPVPG